MKRILIAAVLVAVFSCAVAQNDGIREQLEQVIKQNLETLNLEDLEGHELTLHPDSLMYGQTLSQLPEVFEAYDLDYSIEPIWNYVGMDDSYAYARVTTTTKKLAGPAFRDNRVDQIWVFKRLEGEWRVLTSQILEVHYLD